MPREDERCQALIGRVGPEDARMQCKRSARFGVRTASGISVRFCMPHLHSRGYKVELEQVTRL